MLKFERDELKQLLTLAARTMFKKDMMIFLVFPLSIQNSKCLLIILTLISSSYLSRTEQPFLSLNIQICCENNHFMPSFFKKPTSSGVFTSYLCFIPISYKIGLLILITIINTYCYHYHTYHWSIITICSSDSK